MAKRKRINARNRDDDYSRVASSPMKCQRDPHGTCPHSTSRKPDLERILTILAARTQSKLNAMAPRTSYCYAGPSSIGTHFYMPHGNSIGISLRSIWNEVEAARPGRISLASAIAGCQYNAPVLSGPPSPAASVHGRCVVSRALGCSHDVRGNSCRARHRHWRPPLSRAAVTAPGAPVQAQPHSPRLASSAADRHLPARRRSLVSLFLRRLRACC